MAGASAGFLGCRSGGASAGFSSRRSWAWRSFSRLPGGGASAGFSSAAGAGAAAGAASGKRHRVVGLGAQEVDDVGACFEIRNAWERPSSFQAQRLAGLSARGRDARRSNRPRFAFALQRRRIVEAFERCDLAPDDAIKIGTDRARGALVEAVTDLAQGDTLLRLSSGRPWPKREGSQPLGLPRRRASRRLPPASLLRLPAPPGGHDLRQRRRVVGLGAQERNHVGSLLGVSSSCCARRPKRSATC